jgi:hypothetical protein
MRLITLITLALALGCSGKTENAVTSPGEDGAAGEGGEEGAPGEDGAPGEAGEDGEDGLDCWDLNGDGEPNPEEDINGDGVVDVEDCRGNDSDGTSTGSGEHSWADFDSSYDFSCGLLWDGRMDCAGGGVDFDDYVRPEGAYTDVDVGASAFCLLDESGHLSCQGELPGFADSPSGTFSSVSVGAYFACAIRTDGSMSCWGNNDYGETEPPSYAFKQVDCADGNGYPADFACAITAADEVVCWGSDVNGAVSGVPTGTYTEVTAGASHACAISTDGYVECWGNDDYGKATPPSDTFSQISAGYYHSCGITTDGHTVCWGDNRDGSLWPPLDEEFQLVTVGQHFSCGLNMDGALRCWGYVPLGHPTYW